MPDITFIVNLLQLAAKGRSPLVLENIALHHQVAVYMRSVKRPNINDGDRIFWLTVICMPKAGFMRVVGAPRRLRSRLGARC
jgi:hypothetical protein